MTHTDQAFDKPAATGSNARPNRSRAARACRAARRGHQGFYTHLAVYVVVNIGLLIRQRR
jgi:hypothetical protein